MLYLAYAILALLCFLFGACVFSFLGVVICRVPAGETIVKGRSHCPACGHVLAPGELIPCLSYLRQRGKCTVCGGKIPARDFWLEVFGGGCALVCAARFASVAQAIFCFLVLALLTAVACIDWDTMLIKDQFSLLLLLLGVAAFRVFPDVGWKSRLLGAVVISVPMLVLALLIPGAFGGGDIKLMVGAGLLLGWPRVLLAAALAVFGGGAYGAWLLSRRKAGKKDHFAFGPFLCAGIAVALLWGDGVIGWYLGLFGLR